jgi:hypothetical protein
VLSSDIKEAFFVTQTLTSHHVCNRGGFFCLQISSHSRIMRVKAFYGTSENAVKTQIWIAVSIYVLVAIVRKRLGLAAFTKRYKF